VELEPSRAARLENPSRGSARLVAFTIVHINLGRSIELIVMVSAYTFNDKSSFHQQLLVFTLRFVSLANLHDVQRVTPLRLGDDYPHEK
jgi:hypothetical protein